MNKIKILLVWVLWLLFAGSPGTSWAQTTADSIRVNAYFESIIKDKNLLRQFFSEMPKGGDIHNHLTGSAYAETYFELACRDSLWVDMDNGKLYTQKPSEQTASNVLRLYASMPNLHNVRMTLIDKWSIRNFEPYKSSFGADEYFFGTFGLFGAVTGKHMVELMAELRRRAATENVQYLEVMVSSPKMNKEILDAACGKGFYDEYNEKLKKYILHDKKNIYNKNVVYDKETIDDVYDVLAEIYKKWQTSPAMEERVKEYVQYIDSIDVNSALEAGYPRAPVCYYQGYASRNSDPLVVFAQLYTVYEGCSKKNTKLVGVNIVAAENSEVSMAHYNGHMKMFDYLNRTPVGKNVNTSLHAGEMTLGLVRPEYLSSHISEAVYTAKAKRIGHGVDIAFEPGSVSLLQEMKRNNIIVEINLVSNEFILGVKEDAHPFPLYRKAGVPVVISTDDPGILRTNLTQQYVLLALRYGVGYYEIKELIRNGIRYGFLPDKEKKELLKRLETELSTFESKWANNILVIQNWK